MKLLGKSRMPKKHKLSAANLWTNLCGDATKIIKKEPLLAGFVTSNVLAHKSFELALAHVLADQLAAPSAKLSRDVLFELFQKCLSKEKAIGSSAKKDLIAVLSRDPAACDAYVPFLFFKGYQALQAHRVAHSLWKSKQRGMALFLQGQVSRRFGVDIHPAARIGSGILMDHATGIVVGETAVIEDDVSILHGVTLGGTGKEVGNRHPKIRKGALIGANVTILGNIEIGACSRIAAGSVVLTSVPAHVTAAGVPARVVGKAGCSMPAVVMDQIPKFPKKESDTSDQNCDFHI